MTKDAIDQWYNPRDVSTTLVKGFAVLSAFDDARLRLSLPEIGQKTGYDRATVRRLVITLVDLGLLAKTDKTFSLTPEILGLAANYLRGHGIGTTLQPILNSYSERIGVEISLATMSEGSALYIARSHMSGSAVSFGFTVGSRLPLLHTALGRMLLGTLAPETAVEHILTDKLIQYTPQTLLDPQAIKGEIQKARAQGYSVVVAEFEPGVAGLAVPVGRLGAAKAVIGVSGPVAKVQDAETQDLYLSTLHICAGEIDRVWVEGV